MRYKLLLNTFKFFRAKEDKAFLTMWEKAVPFSLEELEWRLMALAEQKVKETTTSYPEEPVTESFEEFLAQLEIMWERMEDLDDCSVV